MVNKYIKEIEKLNYDYLQIRDSDEYQLGTKIKHLKKKGIKGVFKHFLNSLKFRKINQTTVLYNLSFEEQEKLQRLGRQDIKVVIYTCITGNYDVIISPYFTANNIDYVLFSDNEIKNEIWQFRKIPEHIKNIATSNSMINRYIKFHPLELFEKEYDYAIYIDGNICPVSDMSVMCEQLNNSIGLGFHAHCARNCIYEEVKACKILKKGNPIKLTEQIKKYKKIGFPEQYGMVEGNVIISDLRNKRAKQLLDDCWEELITADAGRDQLVIPYVMWKNNIKMQDICTLGKNVYKNPKIRILTHKD